MEGTMLDHEKLDAMYSAMQTQSANNILEFLIKMEKLDLNKETDRMVIFHYNSIARNYLGICNKMDLDDSLKSQLIELSKKLISIMNKLHDEQSL
jgi:hypothetical protein